MFQSAARSVMASILLIGAISISESTAKAGPFPNILDDNRNNTGLTFFESNVMTLAASTLGLPVNPQFLLTLPIVLNPRALTNPEIHNLYWDDDWNGHKNSFTPSLEQIDSFTDNLIKNPNYFQYSAEYDGGIASFTSSHSAGFPCLPLNAPAQGAELVAILLWTSCMASYNPASLFIPPFLPGLLPPASGVPKAKDNSLYMVYIPSNSEPAEKGCSEFGGYHFFGFAPDVGIMFTPFPIPVPYTRDIPYGVVFASCSRGSTPVATFDSLQRSAGHEMIEAITDPIVPLGWINTSIASDNTVSQFLATDGKNSTLIQTLRDAEVADICQSPSATMAPDPKAFLRPTEPIKYTVNDPLLGQDHIIGVAYWSNQKQACVPFTPVTTLNIGNPKFETSANFVTSDFISPTTPISLSATDGGSMAGISSIFYRYYPSGTGTLNRPAFSHSFGSSVSFFITGNDGAFDVEYYAVSNDGTNEHFKLSTIDPIHPADPAYSRRLVLDTKPPSIALGSPLNGSIWPHSSFMPLSYSVNDAGAGLASGSPTVLLDGQATIGGLPLTSGRIIDLLVSLSLGSHTLTINAEDKLGQASSQVTSIFTIIVTAQSIKDEVTRFRNEGMIKNNGITNSLLAKLNAAEDARQKGMCDTASNIYGAFQNEVSAQSGGGIDTTQASMLLADSQYLIAHCP